MAVEQRYAFADGSVKSAPGWRSPSPSDQKRIVEEAFRGPSNSAYEWIDESSSIKVVSLEGFDGEKKIIHFALRAVSGGGRPETRPNELRSQIAPEILNNLCAINKRGDTALILGVYRNGDAVALVLWRPLDGSFGGGSASKQINAGVVAKALVNGISSAVYPDGEIVYAVVPNMLRAYVDCFMPHSKPTSAELEQGEIVGPRNLIYFGAPGTGKSHQLNMRAIGSGEMSGLFSESNVCRVTFHPDYTYAQFVGCFKPFTEYVVDDGKPLRDMKPAISYRFVPGPFLETYMKAVQNPSERYLLIVDEINRANPAAVFGDLFQLLDRGDDGASEYSVATPVEMREYLKVFLPEYANDKINKDMLESDKSRLEKMAERLSLPSNMYIWATMNSADQGVFPIDTAFKRRWDFKYMDINDPVSVAVMADYDVPLGETGERVKWNDLRVAINDVLRRAKVNEDKWIGPFFIKPSVLRDDEAFLHAFKDKVLLYLYEDAAKTKRSKVFSDESKTYSELCKAFDEEGFDIFKGIGSINVFSAIRDGGGVGKMGE